MSLDGALLLDKPLGVSSNFALQKAKKLFGARKAGHGGTLDPLASGLLLVLFGEATKFAGPLLDGDKEYLATLQLGITTATGDAEGEVLERKSVALDESLLQGVLGRFRGEIEQIPPMYSALKHEGEPLYKLARRGEEIERKPRRVTIHELLQVGGRGDRPELRVRCTKGTYVRTLAQDIGAALGCGAHLAALRRTGSGRFRLEDAATLEALEAMTQRCAGAASCRSPSCLSACRAPSSTRRRPCACATGKCCPFQGSRRACAGCSARAARCSASVAAMALRCTRSGSPKRLKNIGKSLVARRRFGLECRPSEIETT